ncbi:AzlC family ABC transporter permease [Photobacterium halotolerans]|uniref:Branched-chain amino acid ABC transporter permease n=1 Tax=Photobacterium halotolerans TaxID=265726 RepID=A0A7X5ASH3_9GAMM|nr:AzlC family ABC transporter permease [Photobacterium halotolerans]NAW64291.1 branched-chain amino acid ABC transporter permease [Photobacterium halotolerans]
MKEKEIPKETSAVLLTGKEKRRLFKQGALAVMPLCVAVIPWGLLAGSFAIDAGLDVFQSVAMSAIVFAGAAQLVATGLLKAGIGIVTILLTTFFITSRHLLYSITMRNVISPLSLRWRLGLGFLLTDELFALCGNQSPQRFQPWYALGAGLWFYISWNIATLAGIFAGKFIPNLDSLGLDFAIAATFIAIVVPSIQRWPVLITVLIALVMSVLMAALDIEGGLMIASLTAMLGGYMSERLMGNTLIHGEVTEKQQEEK